MQISRTVLAKMDTPYAVTLHREADCIVAYAASEQEGGRSLCFKAPDWKPRLLASGPGGCMGVVPLRETSMQGVLLIEDFIPVFNSARSGAALYTPSGTNGAPWTRRRVFDLPFLHRLAPVRPHGQPLFVAGQLCRQKDSIDDWSSPGAVYLIRPNAEEGPWEVEPRAILDGLHRNHGLFTQRLNGEDSIYVAADEGIFLLRQPRRRAEWLIEPILSEPTSDLWMFDMDGDGRQEMATIHPFHGDTARLYKQLAGRWQSVWEANGVFGHVVWIGQLRGHVCMILGWRGGDKSLDLYTLEDATRWRFSKQTLDANVAPLNISVLRGRHRDLIIASHGATNEVVLYVLS